MDFYSDFMGFNTWFIYGLFMVSIWRIYGSSMDTGILVDSGYIVDILGKFHHDLTSRPKPETAIDDGEWIREIIAFYGRTIQVSELL